MTITAPNIIPVCIFIYDCTKLSLKRKKEATSFRLRDIHSADCSKDGQVATSTRSTSKKYTSLHGEIHFFLYCCHGTIGTLFTVSRTSVCSLICHL